MAQQIINIWTSPNDNTGDTIRSAFDKTNDNFDELYTADGQNVKLTWPQTIAGDKTLTGNTTLSWSLTVWWQNWTSAWTSYTPIVTGSGGGTPWSYSFQSWWHKVIGKKLSWQVYIAWTKWTLSWDVFFSLPSIWTPVNHVEVAQPVIFWWTGTNFWTSLWYWIIQNTWNMRGLSWVVTSLSWSTMPTSFVITWTFEYEIA